MGVVYEAEDSCPSGAGVALKFLEELAQDAPRPASGCSAEALRGLRAAITPTSRAIYDSGRGRQERLQSSMERLEGDDAAATGIEGRPIWLELAPGASGAGGGRARSGPRRPRHRPPRPETGEHLS